MVKYIIYLNSTLIFIIGFCYYFEYLSVQDQTLKGYGLMLLILSVLLACSQLPDLPKKLSNTISMSCVCALLMLQLIPMIDWSLPLICIPENQVQIQNDLIDLIPTIFILVICLVQVGLFLCIQRQVKKQKKLKSRT